MDSDPAWHTDSSILLGTLPISARLWDSPRQTAIEITDAVQYNYLNQDPTPLPNNIHGTQTSNADTQAGIDLMRYQQTNHLMRTSQGQLSDHLMRTSPALLTNPGIPSSLLDAEALNSLLSGDMPPPPAPSSGPLSYEQMRQNAGGLYGQYGDRGLGNPYGLPSTHLTRMSAESTPGANILNHLQRGSLDTSLTAQNNPANLAYSHLNRHSAGNALANDSQHQLAWDKKGGLQRLQAQQLQARLADSSTTSDYPRSSTSEYPRSSQFPRNMDYLRMHDQGRGQDFAQGQDLPASQDFGRPTNDYARRQSLDYGRNQSGESGISQADFRWNNDAVLWQNSNDQLNGGQRAPQGPYGDLGLQPLEARTFSGNSLDSGHDHVLNHGEKLLGANDGSYPGLLGLGRDQGIGTGEEVQKQREKNRNAQKRFRERQKERMKDSQKQMEALTEQMNRLMQEKAELETRNRILEQVVMLNVEHVDQLQSNKEVLNIEQMMLLENYTEFFSKVKQVPKDSVEDAKKWLLGDLLEKDFQVFIDRIQELYTAATKMNDRQALDDLNELILLRREHEKQGALFSSFYWAVYCWNVEETQKRSAEIPLPCKWHQVLADLHLTKDQETEMLNARRRMLGRLNNLAEQRKSMISQLGLELLQSGSDKLHTCPVVQDLRLSLEAEREAVFNFMFTAVDETLTPAQEAFLDIASYPWCPDIWAITGILAQQHEEPKAPLPAIEISSPVLAPILPHSTAFQVLTTPLTAVGIGLRLKRGLAMCKTTGVLPKAAYPLLTQKQLAGRTWLEVQCGRWKKFSTRDWQTRCLLANEIVSNSLESKDDGYISP